MKHSYLLGLTMLFLAPNYSVAADTISVASSIKEVTVFLKGAQVHRTAKATIEKGITYLKLEGLSPQIDKNSIQVEGKGDFTILSVNHQMSELQKRKVPAAIKLLEDSVNNLSDQLDYQKNVRSVYEDEKAMILANQTIKDNGTTIFVEDLEDMADFFRKRLSNIIKTVLEIKKKEKDLSRQIAEVNREIYLLKQEWNKRTSEIIIDVSSAAKIPATISLSYFIYNAGWEPLYDVRAIDDKSPIELVYKANVYQNSGMDWNNVQLTLATINPELGGTKPALHPWVLRFQAPVVQLEEKTISSKALIAADEEVEIKASSAPMKAARTASSFTEVTTSTTFKEFKIALPYNIPTTGEKTTVEVQQHTLSALYKYYCVPKLDQDAFLLAKISGWDNLNLLSGQASIYFKGTFVGKALLNTTNTNDTLDISLGRDKDIVVTRTKLTDFTKTQTVGNNIKKTFAYEVTARNKKNTPVTLVIEDQLPVSSNKDISIDMDEAEGAKYNKVTGQLTWELNMSPSTTNKVKYIFSVKYPKEQSIHNL